MRCLGSLIVLAFVLAPTLARAQRAADLGSPVPRAGDAPAPRRQVPSDDASAVQDISATRDADGSARVFGDGHEADVSWEDPELDVEPRGVLHLAMGMVGAWLGGTASFDEAASGTFVVAIDVVLVPSISLHLRFGGALALRTETRRDVMGSPGANLRSAAFTARGLALFGAPLGQLVAIRGGIELGEGRAFIFGVGDAGTLGFALVALVGLRLFSGRLELGAELAGDLREGSVITRSGASSIQEMAPRVGAYFSVTL